MNYTLYKVTTTKGGYLMRVPWGRDAESVERQLADGTWADRQPGTRELPVQVCDVNGAKGAAMAMCWDLRDKVVTVEETVQ